MPYTFINCLLRQWGGVQHKWYQGSKSCLIYLVGDVCKLYCPNLVNKSRAGKEILVSISRNIMHVTQTAALVTKSYSSQDKGTICLLLTVGQISCDVQSLVWACSQIQWFFPLPQSHCLNKESNSSQKGDRRQESGDNMILSPKISSYFLRNILVTRINWVFKNGWDVLQAAFCDLSMLLCWIALL